MRTYTEKELLKAIEYACNYQKACDYQSAGHFLIEDEPKIEELLDELSDTDKNSASEITLEEIHEYINN